MARIDQKSFYLKSIQKYGKTARGVAWSDAHRQERRFSVLLGQVDRISEAVIVDAGCGFGDLFLYMKRRGMLPKKYIGIDMIDSMVEEARAKCRAEILKRDMLKDPLPEADWYLASGSFNLLTRFETLLALRRFLEVSRCGVIFNLLKGREREGIFNYWMPEEIQRACRTFGRVTIYEGYLEGDFTVKIES